MKCYGNSIVEFKQFNVDYAGFWYDEVTFWREFAAVKLLIKVNIIFALLFAVLQTKLPRRQEKTFVSYSHWIYLN